MRYKKARGGSHHRFFFRRFGVMLWTFLVFKFVDFQAKKIQGKILFFQFHNANELNLMELQWLLNGKWCNGSKYCSEIGKDNVHSSNGIYTGKKNQNKKSFTILLIDFRWIYDVSMGCFCVVPITVQLIGKFQINLIQ